VDTVTPSRPRSGGHSWGARLRDGVAEILAGRSRLVFVLPAAIAALLLLFPLFGGSAYWIRELSLIGAMTLVVSGVNLSFGYAGEVQFGQVFMFAAGAYVPLILAVGGFNQIIVLMCLGGVVAALVGALVAIPALRVGGWSLALASFFLVLTIPDLVGIFERWTGGRDGLVGIPAPHLFGLELGTTGLYEVVVVVTILWMACYRNLVTSRYGVVFRALRESPILTRSLGFSTFRLKLATYSIGAFPAGIAGCLFGYVSLIVQPDSFGFDLAIGIVAASVLGGVESIYGAVLGAAILQLLPEQSLSFASFAPVAYGLFLLVAAIVLRKGLGGLSKAGLAKLGGWIRSPATRESSTPAAATRPGAAHHERQNALAELLSASAPSEPEIARRRLALDGVSKSFGGVHALDGVSLAAEPGSVTALIGSNGSGKTTLLNVICGYITPDTGSVRLGGSELLGLPAHRVATRGVGRTFQTPMLPRGVSVADVVASGRYGVDRCGFLASIFRLPRQHRTRTADRTVATSLLEAIGLEHLAGEEAASLPLGTRRLVEVARCLCGAPRLVLLDEAASGLSEDEVDRLGELITALARAGASVVVIEHNFPFVTRVADTVHVLHLGGLLASGPGAEIARDPRVIESYLGQSAETPSEPERAAPIAAGRTNPRSVKSDGAALLSVENLDAGYGDLRVLRGVSLSVAQGSVEVLLGRNGVGKTTLLSAIAGAVPTWRGTVSLAGTRLGKRPAYRRAASGIAFVQEGKRIFRARTVWQNVLMGTYPRSLGRGARTELCRSLLAEFPILRDRADQPAGSLSGGQQQMLAIAQALASQPRILLLDEPSAGLAPSIVDELFARVRTLAEEGLTVLLVEQLAQKAVAIADHVTVLENGRVAAAGPPGEFADLDQLHDVYFNTTS
jgi:branched-chain amino acid transport system permease protein